ncbi:MAG: hypothetical protein Q9162_006914 [Coniocarpon cinnabarinum]
MQANAHLRIFPFGITVGGLTILFIVFLLVLISIRRLLPSVILVFSFLLFALYLTGLVETAIQLFSSSSNVNSNCQNYVLGSPVYGQTLNTLAWLEQQGICQSWYAAFSFWIIGAVFLNWVKLRAGPSRKCFGAHKDVLTTRSTYFRAMFASPFFETGTGIVDMPEDDPEVVHAYVHFLYHGTIKFQQNGGSENIDDWTIPLKMWLFGDKHQDTEFADSVMDAIIYQSHDLDQDGNRWFPVQQATKLVYQNTASPNNPLRRLLVAQHVRHGRIGWYQDCSLSDVDPTFLLDLTMAFFEQRVTGTAYDSDDLHNTCTYHLQRVNRGGFHICTPNSTRLNRDDIYDDLYT